MNFTILTLFPEMVNAGLHESIIGRAIENQTISVNAVNIRDFSEDKHKRVDDYTYGGGAGMLMQAEPVYRAIQSVRTEQKKCRVIYVTPQGLPFHQRMAQDFAKEEELIFLCGHYEGIDERVLEECVTDYVSIGDYVLTGGELAAMVMIDAIARLVPGVLHNEISAETESFQGDLLEYPQYSRPRVWHDREVPQVLLSGNTRDIRAWRLEQSMKRTKSRRPDLYEKYEKLQEISKKLSHKKIYHMDMIEGISRGYLSLVEEDESGCVLISSDERYYYHACYEPQTETFIVPKTLDKNAIFVEHSTYCAFGEDCKEYLIGALTRREKLPIRGLYCEDGKKGSAGISIVPYEKAHEALIAKWGLNPGDMTLAFVACYQDIPSAVIALQRDGSIGQLYVEPSLRRKHIAMALVTYLCNKMLENGQVPFVYLPKEQSDMQELYKKTGFYVSADSICMIQPQEGL